MFNLHTNREKISNLLEKEKEDAPYVMKRGSLTNKSQSVGGSQTKDNEERVPLTVKERQEMIRIVKPKSMAIPGPIPITRTPPPGNNIKSFQSLIYYSLSF